MSAHHPENKETLHLHAPVCDLDLCHPLHMNQYSTLATDQPRFYWAIGLTAVVMTLEIIGGLLTNSLALLSDAGHMLSHLLALVISFLAIIFSRKAPTLKNSYGYYRLEILAALFNGFFLFLITLWILYEAYSRLGSPEAVATTEMTIIATIGLCTNLLTAYFLSGTHRKDMNTRSAILHLMGDTLASVGVVAGAVVIAYTGWLWVDPLLAALISILILYWALGLIREAIDVLLEATPSEINPERVVEAVSLFEEVQGMHDVHVWTLTSGMYALSAHVAIRNMSIKETRPLLKKINFLLCQRFKIGHAAIQLEAESSLRATAK
jgi:cobalt-zinc-cadmium efflux system protein